MPTSLAADGWLHRPLPDPSKVPAEEREQAFEAAYRNISELIDAVLAQHV